MFTYKYIHTYIHTTYSYIEDRYFMVNQFLSKRLIIKYYYVMIDDLYSEKRYFIQKIKKTRITLI